MQIPIINGIYTDNASDFRTAYPKNLVPVPKEQGISAGYLRPAEGIVQFSTGTGLDRGGINWNGECYRVMGNSLVKIASDGVVTTLGTIPGTTQVTLDYSFDKLAIAANHRLFYYSGSGLVEVTDPDLGDVIDVCWVDGYFMTTDGTSLVVTELNDPTAVNPLKYGSSEADPDQVKAIVKVRNEIYALNRYTIEAFQDVGGDLFPFQRISGAQIMRGTIGTHTNTKFLEGIAFLGSGRNEPPAIWVASNSSSLKLSTREIDQILLNYSEETLSKAVLECRVSNNHQSIYLHLPDQTLVYDGAGSAAADTAIWYVLTTSVEGLGQYKAINFVWCYDKWLCGDPTSSKVGYLTSTVSTHYGAINGWEFSTDILYNEGKGVIFHELELVCLTGNTVLGIDPTIWTSYTLDGQTWSQEKPRSAGKIGERLKRVSWLQQGSMRNWRCQKVRGTSDAHISVVRLEARIEPLNV